MSIEEKLITLVGNHPVLFDASHKDYYNITLKESIWDIIGADLQEPGDVLKKRWNNLRDAYRKALLKRNIQHLQGAPKKSRPWRYEKQMHFLNDHLASPQLRGNLSVILGEQCNQDDEEVEEDHVYLNISAEQLSESEASDATESGTTQTTTQISTFLQKRTGEKHKNRASEGNTPSTATVLEKYLANKVKRKAPQADDHITAFFKSAEATVRTFSYLHQVQIKAEISSLLSKYEMQNLIEAKKENKSFS